MKSSSSSILTLSAIVSLAVVGQSAFAGNIFSDDFSSSTVNVAPVAPTSTSTSYEIASTKNAPAASMSTGNFSFGLPSTSSAFVEAQALFPSVTLGSVGDYVNLNFVFTDTSGILGGSGTSATLNVGLYDSGGVAPLTGLDQSGLSSATTYNTGGAQLWQGYMGRVFQSGTAGIYTRNQQNAVTDGTGNDNNGNQDLLFTGAGTGTYKNPTGTSLGTAASALALTGGNQYTVNYRITSSAAGQYTIAYDLYDGVGTGGTDLWSQSVTTSTILTSTFSGMAIGWRYSGVSSDPASTMDVNSLTIDAVSSVPEPASMAIFGFGVLGMVLGYRRVRR